MARKPASRSNTGFSSTALSIVQSTSPDLSASTIQPTAANVAYSPSATVAGVAGGTASVPSHSSGLDPSDSIPSAPLGRKKTLPKSKNHGRFPCSIPGCFAVANHLSSMCRHKWGHLPQRLLPACRGHLPNGAPCPVRYQGRADTMKRHWLTHHTNEGPWLPDRYPPFEDLWKLVKEGEIVLTPPSKYAYDSPVPEHLNTASPLASSSGHGGDGPNTGAGRRNSIAIDTDQHSFSNHPEFSRDSQIGARRNSFSGRLTWSPIDSRRSREVRISRGNNRPWKYSDPVAPYEEDGDVDELNEVDGDIDMEDVMHDEALLAGQFLSASPSHHSQQSLRDSPAAHSHYSRSQRSNSNPKSPASLRSLAMEQQDSADVHIHVHHARIPPITSLSPSSEAEPTIVPRLPLHPASNYPLLPTSSMRDHDSVYNQSSKAIDGLDLLAVSATRAHGRVYASENHNPRSIEIVKLGQGSLGMGGQYVYGHKKESPPAPTFMPASIPHSELSLLSHPPTDRILPPSPRANGINTSTNPASDTPFPPTRISTEEANSFADSYTPHGAWQSHHHSQRGAGISWPITVAIH